MSTIYNHCSLSKITERILWNFFENMTFYQWTNDNLFINYQPISQSIINGARICWGYVGWVVTNLRMIKIKRGRAQRRRDIILGYTVQYNFVKIILYECILHNICIQDCHFLNECRLVFCRYVVCRKFLYWFELFPFDRWICIYDKWKLYLKNQWPLGVGMFMSSFTQKNLFKIYKSIYR